MDIAFRRKGSGVTNLLEMEKSKKRINQTMNYSF